MVCVASMEGRVGGKDGGRKKRVGWKEDKKRMLLLPGDRFNHPGEKTQAKQCWGKKQCSQNI